MSRARLLLCVLGALGAAAAVAPAGAGAIEFRGETAKGVAVVLRVSPGGTPKRFEVAKTVVRCRNGTLHQRRRRYRDLDRARVGHFADRFKARIRDDGVVLRERTRYEGDRDAKGEWRGTYEVNVRVYRKGARIDTCNLRTRWRASRSGRR